MPACLPEQLWKTGSGGRLSWSPQSSSSSLPPVAASNRRTASTCSGVPKCDAEAIASSSSLRFSNARARGSACRGFAEERNEATSAGSPASATTDPSWTAIA